MIILCGSSMSYMEDNVLSYKAPLYGRRTSQLRIQPLDFKQVCKFFPNFTNEDKAIVYGMVGGTPQYILQMNDLLSIEDNIKNTFLDSSSFFYEEPLNLLKQEVREPAFYNSIITVVASGVTKLSEIASKVGEETAVCSVYIKTLINLGILKKELPYKEISTKKTIYVLDDNMFRFWYRFVMKNQQYIARGVTELAYSRVSPFISEYMGFIFEELCKQYLWECLLNGNSPVLFTDLGRWWGNDSKNRCEVEIDIMGEQDKTTACFAECKWQNEKVEVDVLNTLISRSQLFHYSTVHLYIFSKSGFTESRIDKANQSENIHLISFEEMMKVFLS